MPDEAATKCLLQSLMTFLGGGLVGTILGHFLAIGRDARNRKHASETARQTRIREFRAVMGGLRSWGENYCGQVPEFYARIPIFREATARIRDDIPEDQRRRFDETVRALSELGIGELADYDIIDGEARYAGKHHLLKAIDAVIKCLD